MHGIRGRVAVAVVALAALGASGLAEAAPSHSAAPALITLHASEFGKVIFGAHNRALYLFAADHGAKSTCYGACAAAWPPLLTKGAPTVGAGLNAKLVGTTTRNDGSLQVTYNGHPLYYFSGDTPGKVKCQAVKLNGGFWYVVKANGTANTSKSHHM
jgi:predicted lipoprotein with Yx(FWY)xxD motif